MTNHKPHNYEAVAAATAKTANFVQLPHVYRYGVWVEVGLGLGWSLGWGGVWVGVGVRLGLDLGWGGVRVGVSLELGWDSVWGYYIITTTIIIITIIIIIHWKQ